MVVCSGIKTVAATIVGSVNNYINPECIV